MLALVKYLCKYIRAEPSAPELLCRTLEWETSRAQCQPQSAMAQWPATPSSLANTVLPSQAYMTGSTQVCRSSLLLGLQQSGYAAHKVAEPAVKYSLSYMGVLLPCTCPLTCKLGLPLTRSLPRLVPLPVVRLKTDCMHSHTIKLTLTTCQNCMFILAAITTCARLHPCFCVLCVAGPVYQPWTICR